MLQKQPPANVAVAVGACAGVTTTNAETTEIAEKSLALRIPRALRLLVVTQ